MQLTFGFKQIVFLLFLIVLLVAGLALGAFLLGQQNALRLGNPVVFATTTVSSAVEQSPAPGTAVKATSLADAVQATLPRAMTATPKPVQSEEIIFTDAQATELAREKAGQSAPDIPFEIQSVFFTPGRVNLTGTVAYLGYNGEFNITGTPYLENGRLRVKVNSITIAGQSLPGEAYTELENQINALFKEFFTGYDLQSVTVEEGQMRLTALPW